MKATWKTIIVRKMFGDYERQTGNPALQSKTGRELPWIAKMRKHCDGYMKDAKLAADADRFAEFHRMRAEEMRASSAAARLRECA